MTVPTRTPGRYGARPPSNRDAIAFADIRTGAPIPPHPASEDYLSRLSGWLMLGNDSAGDCVAVTWANFRRFVTALLGGREVYPSQDQVWTVYKTQNPDFDPNGSADDNGPGSSADGGMDIQTLLEHLVKVGGPDGVKALAFAKVDFTNEDELDAALAIFGGTWDGFSVTNANETQFSNSQPWDYVPGSPNAGGHSVLSGGYKPGIDDFITWAQETDFTAAFRTHQMVQCYIVIWPENLGTTQFEAGIDRAALASAYAQVTGGKVLVLPPVPSPTPTPSPTPAPVPTPSPAPVTDVHMDSADEALAAELVPWLNERHIGDNEKAVRAVDAWLNAKNAAVA